MKKTIKKVIIVLVVLGVGFLVLVMYLGGALHFKHNMVEEQQAPTCTSEGYVRDCCTKCSKTVLKSTIPALGHDTTVTKEGLTATCTSTGLSAELYCKRCDRIVQEQTVISKIPHDYSVTLQGTPATCEASGISDEKTCNACGDVVAQVVILPLGHSDEDTDLFCDRCHKLVAENPVTVSNLSELNAIRSDLNGVYMLTANIDLGGAAWTPIGTKETPFTGVFYGNGYKITNLKNDDSAETGLFGCNKGRLYAVKIENYTAVMTEKQTAAGAIAAVNEGIIADSAVSGTISVTYTVNQSYKKYREDIKHPYQINLGMISGINQNKVENCKVEGTMNETFSAIGKYTMEWHLLDIPRTFDFLLTLTVNSGHIAGVNDGTVTACESTAYGQANVSSSASTGNEYAHCVVTTEYAIGSLVGSNNGKLLNSKGKPYAVVEEKGGTSTYTMNAIYPSGYESKITAHKDATYTGLIGQNKGEVSGVTSIGD